MRRREFIAGPHFWSVHDDITSCGIAVVLVPARLNGVTWLVGSPRLCDLNVFSAGFVLGMLGM
jgi:hypothetical protein